MISPVLLCRILLLFGLMSLGGCAAIGNFASSSLEAIGLKKPDIPDIPNIPEIPEIPDAQKPPRTIVLKLHAGENLNAGANGRPLALVARIYKLRQNGAFQQATYDTFLNPQKEKEVLGAELLEVKEITLIPGQHYEVTEKVTKEAYYIGVVALFRSPAAQRWRVTFPAKEAEKSGIIVGVHACALTVGTGAVIADNVNLRSLVRC
ncbi:MAG: type VI secretion system lipoprotein TssJ [Gammaproteobacteria bacterium]